MTADLVGLRPDEVADCRHSTNISIRHNSFPA